MVMLCLCFAVRPYIYLVSQSGHGIVASEDYEEVDRFNRQGRSGRGRAPGLQQNVRSWRYNR